MKVLLLNGSPHEKGCTYTALSEAAGALEAGGIETEILWLGRSAGIGCMGCGACAKLGKCVVDDAVNTAAEKARECDGLIVGSPVHYASASGQATGVLDRLFISAGAALRYKPGAAVVSARRAGTTAALDQLNKYFMINQMPVVSSRYWNMVHGSSPEDVMKDEEGIGVMRTLGHNMAWLLKCIAAGRESGVPEPVQVPPARTNFIR
ncbi:MAG: flavodoxin family protein [Oscillospiraceae bacterium]|nr:flavodoxin family protein [Oscillospiraceae bacterium]